MQMFIVDSCSSNNKINEVRASLEKCLSDPTLRGLPLLLLCNKQDLPSAQTVDQVYHLYKSFMHVVQGYNQKFTPGDSFPNLPPYQKLMQKYYYIFGLVKVFVIISECMEHVLANFSSLINPFMIVVNITMSCV